MYVNCTKNGLALTNVKEQTPELCLAAVKQNEYALKYVENQTSELCLEAVKQDSNAWKYVKDKSMLESISPELKQSKTAVMPDVRLAGGSRLKRKSKFGRTDTG